MNVSKVTSVVSIFKMLHCQTVEKVHQTIIPTLQTLKNKLITLFNHFYTKCVCAGLKHGYTCRIYVIDFEVAYRKVYFCDTLQDGFDSILRLIDHYCFYVVVLKKTNKTTTKKKTPHQPGSHTRLWHRHLCLMSPQQAPHHYSPPPAGEIRLRITYMTEKNSQSISC